MSSRWLSVQEITHHLGVSRDTVYRWIEDRKLPAHRIGRFWKFKIEEVDEWVLAGKAQDTEPRERRPASQKKKKTGE